MAWGNVWDAMSHTERQLSWLFDLVVVLTVLGVMVYAGCTLQELLIVGIAGAVGLFLL